MVLIGYDNSEYEAYYCPKLVKIFYSSINQNIIDLDAHQFIVHLATGDIIVTTDMIEDYTQAPSNPHHSEPLPLIEYMTTWVLVALSRTVGSKPVQPSGIYIALDARSNAISSA